MPRGVYPCVPSETGRRAPCGERETARSPHAAQPGKEKVLMGQKPRILFWDLETFPNIVTSWGLRVDGYLSPDNIIQERTIICGCWSWLGQKDVFSVAINPKEPTDDKALVEKFHDVLSQADVIVAHNGDSFDIRWFNARAAYHGLRPIPPAIQFDTKKMAKDKFYFNSNKLSYLCQFFHFGKKIKTEFDLWKDCMSGDAKALAKMVLYCRRDILLLKKLYFKLSPYMMTKMTVRRLVERGRCTKLGCGSTKIQYRGYMYTTANKYRRFQCLACGGWDRNTKAEKVGVDAC